MAVSKLTPAHIARRIAARRDRADLHSGRKQPEGQEFQGEQKLREDDEQQMLVAAWRPMSLTPAPQLPESDVGIDGAQGASGGSPFRRRLLEQDLHLKAANSDPLTPDAADMSVLNVGAWRRECFILPPEKARETAAAWLDQYPRARWRSEIENWRVVSDNLVQLILRRLPDAKNPR